MHAEPVFIGRNPKTLPPGIDKPIEDDDPYALTGVRYPVAEGVDADREVTLAIIEEYALSGWPAERIRRLFAMPESGSIHDIFRRRGSQMIDEMLISVFGIGRAAEEHPHG